MSESIRIIQCECGNWEEMVADDARANSQSFDFITSCDSGEAFYSCMCGIQTKSYTSEDQSDNIPDSFYDSIFIAGRIEKGAICFLATNKANQELSFVIDMNHPVNIRKFDYTTSTTIGEILECNIECVTNY